MTNVFYSPCHSSKFRSLVIGRCQYLASQMFGFLLRVGIISNDRQKYLKPLSHFRPTNQLLRLLSPPYQSGRWVMWTAWGWVLKYPVDDPAWRCACCWLWHPSAPEMSNSYNISQEGPCDQRWNEPKFFSPSWAQAKSVEPRWARACQNNPQALFECENFTNKLKSASSGLLRNLGSRSLEPLAYLLPAKNLDQAIESKPKLIPPLPAIGNWGSIALKLPTANMRFRVILENLNNDNQKHFLHLFLPLKSERDAVND